MRLGRVRLLFLLLLAGRSLTLPCADAAPCQCGTATGTAASTGSVRAEDAVWLISTRHLGCPDQQHTQAEQFQVLRCDEQTVWQDANLEQLLSSGPSPRPTVIYIHGNREDWGTAQQRGLLAYRSLVNATADAPAMRFVCWSWPSDQIRGPRRDVLSKAARSDYETYYLALFLARLDPQTRVGLFGFSYGARIITGALHLAGGGTLAGLKLPDAEPNATHRARVVLQGAASHNFWLLPEHAHGECWSQIDQLLVQFNPCDRVLRLYPHIDRCSRPQALGYSGFPWADDLGTDAARLTQQNVSGEIGNAHHALSYLQSSAVMVQVQRYVLWMEEKEQGKE